MIMSENQINHVLCDTLVRYKKSDDKKIKQIIVLNT